MRNEVSHQSVFHDLEKRHDNWGKTLFGTSPAATSLCNTFPQIVQSSTINKRKKPFCHPRQFCKKMAHHQNRSSVMARRRGACSPHRPGRTFGDDCFEKGFRRKLLQHFAKPLEYARTHAVRYSHSVICQIGYTVHQNFVPHKTTREKANEKG